MKNIFLLICIVGSIFNVQAHSSRVSSFVLAESSPNVWNLQITASLSAFQYEFMEAEPNLDLKTIEANKFRQWIIEHLKHEIKLYANGSLMTLGKSAIKLGHQTSIKIMVKGMPNNLESLRVINKSLKNASFQHKNIFKIVKNGEYSKKFNLTTDNNYTIKLFSVGETFEDILVINKKKWNYAYIGSFLLIVLTTSLIWFEIKNKVKPPSLLSS